ncbi:MAG: hypothetical protein EOL97_15840, partial [Spirochaetia bacterium]|nr:hypothetical protein [Spirochaetia bacterium]
MGNGNIIGKKNNSRSGLWNINDIAYNNLLFNYNNFIGVQDTGTRSSNGAELRQVNISSDNNLQLTIKTVDYFNNHPKYQFTDWTDASGNVFVKIPISYWWRGNLPDAVDGTTPRWTMLLSPKPGNIVINGISCTFASSDATFKKNGSYKDSFYIGKYRGHNAGSNKVGSKAGQTVWGNVSFNNFRTYCSNNGADYHMLSLFEWHEILSRMVIEKATFQLMPEATRAVQ